MKQLLKSPLHLGVILWAGAWAQFLIAEALMWRTVEEGAILWIALGLLFVLLAIVPWRWELQGGALLLICGLGLLVAYQLWPPTQLRPSVQALLVLLLTLPPSLSGVVFLSRRVRPVELRIRTEESLGEAAVVISPIPNCDVDPSARKIHLVKKFANDMVTLVAINGR